MPHVVLSPSAIACKICGQVHLDEMPATGFIAHCCRCGSMLSKHTRRSLARTGAFALAGLVLYLPANLLPILHLELYGATSDNTVWDGVTTFYQDGDLLMAGIVFAASILIPVVKLLGLGLLVVTTALRWRRLKMVRTWLHRAIEGVGRWAMLDVFALAIWVSLVKLDTLGSVTAGPGLLPFAGVVVFTLLASSSFDPQLIWQKDESTS